MGRYYDDELYHHGIKGQRWGIRRFQNKDGSYTSAGQKRRFKSTGLRAAIAKRSNEKVDKSFRSWNENSKKRANAIELGKKRNLDRMAYESDKRNKDLKNAYKQSNKEYKKALKSNTTYRKGQIKKEVGSDLSRKYLSKAKNVEKQLKSDPNNKSLSKEYNTLMSQHAVERAKARRAPEVYANRSRRIATTKRAITMAGKAAIASALVGAGVKAYNKNAVAKGKKAIDATDVYKVFNIAKEVAKYI